jgi:spore germination cell wall hydrolase CwlJ-like protein
MLFATPMVALTLASLAATPVISDSRHLTLTPANVSEQNLEYNLDETSNGFLSFDDNLEISNGNMPAEDTWSMQHPSAPTPPTKMVNVDQLCMAVAIYHEARGESIDGQRAVASVILQRGLVAGRWGNTPCEVIVPVQFSFLDKSGNFDPITDIEAWNKAYRVATEMISNGPLTELEGADHYHTFSVNPSWNFSMRLVAEIDAHRFWHDPDSVVLALSM